MKNDHELVSSSAMRTLMLLRTAIYSGEVGTVSTSVRKGEITVCNDLREVIEDVLELEDDYRDMKLRYQCEKEENERYSELLCGLAPDDLTEEQEEVIKRLVRPWSDWDGESDE